MTSRIGALSRLRPSAANSLLRENPAGRTSVVALPLPVMPGRPVDGITDLPGYDAFRLAAGDAISRTPLLGPRPALLVADLDAFARINEAYGTETGDAVLAGIGARLRRLCPDPRLVFRTGDDEYAVILDQTDTITAVDWARHLHQAICEPVDVPGGTVSVTACVAVVMFGHRQRVDGLVRDADTTMFRAKAEGRNRVDLYNWATDSWVLQRKRDLDRLSEEVRDLQRKNRVLAGAIRVDPETGMPNRLAFDADHLQIHAKWKRVDEPYSLLRVHVDGWEPGVSVAEEEVFKKLAETVGNTVRQYDRTYVTGGGELAVLLHGTRLQQAIAAGERVRKAAEASALGHTVTVAVVETGFRHAGPAELVSEAEALLAQAAAAGSNRVVWPF